MKIEAFNDGAPEERRLQLKLFTDETDGKVDLYAVDSTGEKLLCGRILSISTEGIHRAAGVNELLGLPLTPNGGVQLACEKARPLSNGLKVILDRLRRIMAAKEGEVVDYIVLSNGLEVVRMSEIKTILQHFE